MSLHSVPPLDPETLRQAFADVGSGVRLHYVELGEGPLVLLLHGFPDFWYGWRRQIPALAAAGFRVVAPDLRGYNLSDKPGGVGQYSVRALAQDVARLIDGLGERRAHVVGHDWGAGVAWCFAMAYPDRLARLAVLNGPHPERLLSAMRRPAQLAKSWYIFLFQVPWLPEQALARRGYATLVRAIRDEPTRPGAVTNEDVAAYRSAWSQPGALTAMLNWYRAMLRPGSAAPLRRIDAPTLVLWGEADPHLGVDLATPKPELVPNARIVRLAGASHWVQHDEPERVNDALVEWLRG
jgi:pimeloyl-ACP methyl ester carboxylesterase